MNKTARFIYLLTGSIFPISIGLLHTVAHFKDLITPEIFEHLQKEAVIMGAAQPLWYSWGIMSFMMGASFIIIGLLNISMLKRVPKSSPLPLTSILTMMLFLICVTYVGHTFNQNFQFFGGIFGLVLFSVCGYLTLKFKQD